MVKPHLLLPSVYVFLLLEVKCEFEEWPAVCGMQMFPSCSLLWVIKCGTVLYIRLADKAIAGAEWVYHFNMLERHWAFWRQISLALIVSVCSISHKGFHCCRFFLTHPYTCTYQWTLLRQFSNLLKTLVAIHQSPNPSHVNIKALVSHRDLENLFHQRPGFLHHSRVLVASARNTITPH